MFCSKKKKKAADSFFFLLLHSVISAEEERDRMKGTLDTLSFLVLPTKRRPPWPFGYCKISNSVFYLAHLFRNALQGPRRSARTSDSLTFFFFLLCADRGVASQSWSRKAFIPDDCDSQNMDLTPEMGQISLGVFNMSSLFFCFFFSLSLYS